MHMDSLIVMPGKAMPLSVYYAEVIHGGLVASGGIMAMYCCECF